MLLPLEYHLRSSDWGIFPNLGVAIRRTDAHDRFQALRKTACSLSDFSVCDIDANRFLVSSGSIRCMAERSPCGTRTSLVFRYPLGWVLFVVSAAAGVVLPTALHAPFNMPMGEAVFCVTFMAFFWGCLGSFFLRVFWSIAATDADKLAFALRLHRHAPDGFAARRVTANRMEMKTSVAKKLN